MCIPAYFLYTSTNGPIEISPEIYRNLLRKKKKNTLMKQKIKIRF